MRTLLFSTAFFEIVTDILLKVSGSIWKDLMYDEFKSEKKGKERGETEKQKDRK